MLQLKTYRGFSLVELLVVISIIGILASVVIGSIDQARTSAKNAVVKQEIGLIAEAVGSISLGRPIESITGSWCSACACRDREGDGDSGDLRTVDSSSSAGSQACKQNWENALQNIAAESSVISDVEGLARDPWGSPYMIDENELEYNNPASANYNPCRMDSLRSAGKDGVYNTDDDYELRLPPRTATCF